jgi:hypothetical protein
MFTDYYDDSGIEFEIEFDKDYLEIKNIRVSGVFYKTPDGRSWQVKDIPSSCLTIMAFFADDRYMTDPVFKKSIDDTIKRKAGRKDTWS